MPIAGQVVRVIAAEQAAARDGAHLVIQLRPADASAAVAEPHEFDRVRVGVAEAAVRGSIDGVPPSLPLAGGDEPAWSAASRNMARAGRTGRSGGRTWASGRPAAPPLRGRLPVSGHGRPVRAAPEGGLSTTSSTKLSTRTGVHRTPCVNRARTARSGGGGGSARDRGVGRCQRGRRRARGPRTGRRRAAGSRRDRPSRPARPRPPRPAIPTDVSSMQPRKVRKPSSRGALGASRRAGPMPPHLASLTLTPATTPTSASRSSSGTAHSSATIGIGERSWSQPRSRYARAGKGCSMSSTPRSTSSGSRRSRDRRASSRCWRRPGSGRRRPRGRPGASRGRPARRA